jgi:phosphate transport system permease protein
LEILAGVPSVVYGYFALTMVTPFLQEIIPDLAGFNALGPGIVMGVMILPIVASCAAIRIFGNCGVRHSGNFQGNR